jgi:hypothetical protein
VRGHRKECLPLAYIHSARLLTNVLRGTSVQVGSGQNEKMRRLGQFVVSCLAYVLHKFDVFKTQKVLVQVQRNDTIDLSSKFLKYATELCSADFMRVAVYQENTVRTTKTQKFKFSLNPLEIQLIDSYSCQCKIKNFRTTVRDVRKTQPSPYARCDINFYSHKDPSIFSSLNAPSSIS